MMLWNNNLSKSALGMLMLASVAVVDSAVINLEEWKFGGSYEDITVNVGDQLNFEWTGNHDVHINPSGSCDQEGAIPIGLTSPVSYNFLESDAGTTMYFACNIGIHCTGGGMGFSVTVNPIDTPAPTPAPVGNTITIDPWTFDNYEDLTAKVGDEIVFVWENNHDVWINPSGSCDKQGAIPIGDSSPASYTFKEEDDGKDLFFACNVGSHCAAGMQFTVSVGSGNGGGGRGGADDGDDGDDGDDDASSKMLIHPWAAAAVSFAAVWAALIA